MWIHRGKMVGNWEDSNSSNYEREIRVGSH